MHNVLVHEPNDHGGGLQLTVQSIPYHRTALLKLNWTLLVGCLHTNRVTDTQVWIQLLQSRILAVERTTSSLKAAKRGRSGLPRPFSELLFQRNREALAMLERMHIYGQRGGSC